MERLWIGVHPRPEGTRVLAMAGPERVLLKAQLSRRPSSRLALSALSEALCLWEGRAGRVALVAADLDSCAPRVPFDEEPFGIGHGALVDIEVVDALRRPRRPRDRQSGLGGMGPFDDLRQMLLFEAMR
jgi:hypothetical protein